MNPNDITLPFLTDFITVLEQDIEFFHRNLAPGRGWLPVHKYLGKLYEYLHEAIDSLGEKCIESGYKYNVPSYSASRLGLPELSADEPYPIDNVLLRVRDGLEQAISIIQFVNPHVSLGCQNFLGQLSEDLEHHARYLVVKQLSDNNGEIIDVKNTTVSNSAVSGGETPPEGPEAPSNPESGLPDAGSINQSSVGGSRKLPTNNGIEVG